MLITPSEIQEAYYKKNLVRGTAKGHLGADLKDASAFEHGRDSARKILDAHELPQGHSVLEG